MRRLSRICAAIILVFLAPCPSLAQSPQPASSVTVPRLISISGVFRPADGQPPARVEEVTLAIYADESGGTPLWQESQAVAIDAAGGYTLLLGATTAEGVPLDLFAAGEARWLGVVLGRPGEVEGPRVRVTSVPYALRAADADTLGGRPASAYVLAPTAEGGGTATPSSEGGAAMATSDLVLPGTQNFLAKYVTGTDVGSSDVIELGGRIGIGTSSPVDLLHVRFNNSDGAVTGYAVQNLSNSATAYSGMLFYDHNGALGQFQGFNNSTHEYRINNVARSSGGFQTFDGSINFMIGGKSQFFANSTGVGIGTTAPATHLEVSNAGSPFQSTNVYATSYGGAPTFQGRSARGTEAAPSAIQNGDILAIFSGGGYAQTFFATSKAAIAMRATENWTNGAQGTEIRFQTTANGTFTTLDRMTIDSNGNVGIGTVAPFDRLQVVGDIRVGTSGTNGCIKNFSGAGIAGTCASDARFKRDVTPFGPTLAALTALQPVHFSWRAADFPERHFGTARAYGLIAQDVEPVLPSIVVTGDDGYKAVDYGKLPLLTIQAVKELKAEHDHLTSRVAELERMMNELRAALGR